MTALAPMPTRTLAPTTTMPRQAMGEALVAFAATDTRLLVLDGDVSNSTMTASFRTAYPDRFLNVGIAEQNLVGIAAGLATTGWLPFVSTFAVFATRRAGDQITVSVAYAGLNVTINGSYGGIPTGRAGATHQAFEDIAIMRAIPGMVVLTPSDAEETWQATQAALRHDGPVYLRTVRCE